MFDREVDARYTRASKHLYDSLVCIQDPVVERDPSKAALAYSEGPPERPRFCSISVEREPLRIERPPVTKHTRRRIARRRRHTARTNGAVDSPQAERPPLRSLLLPSIRANQAPLLCSDSVGAAQTASYQRNQQRGQRARSLTSRCRTARHANGGNATRASFSCIQASGETFRTFRAALTAASFP